MTTVNITSFLWVDKNAKHTGTYQFGPKHVNFLFRQLAKGAKALESEGHVFNFTLFTDSPVISDYDLTLGVRFVPMWQDFRNIGRCFTRLKLFDPDVRDKYLPKADFTVMIDLDVVIVDPVAFLRTLATRNRLQAFLGYRDTKNPRCLSGTLWRINEGHFGRFKNVYDSFRHLYDTAVAAGVLEQFFANWNKESSFVGSDQCWLTTVLGEHTYPDKLNDRRDGIYDAWCLQDLPGGELPTNATVVFWNGRVRDPSLPEIQEKFPYVVENWVNV